MDQVRTRLQQPVSHLIAVDGMPRSGKSGLGRRLAGLLNCPIVECDLFIRHGARAYPYVLDLDCLGHVVRKALDRNGPVLVEGVLLHDVLDALGTAASTSIYVRHSWPAGTLTHAALFDSERTETELLDEENELCRAAGIRDSEPVLARELITYHKRRRPHASADILFDVTFASEGDG
jgi:cytidylate kinase